MLSKKVLTVGVLGVAVIGLALFMTIITVNSSKAESSDKYYKFNSNKELIAPEGYRKWVFVGTPLTPNDLNDGKAAFPEFHNVYMDPASFAEYKKTGKFRDGTILVKELVSVGSKAAVSGNGYFAGEFVGLEATIKDSKLFADQPGNWAYFSFSNADHSLPYKKTAGAFPAEACNACHQASAAEDWVFTQYYPAIRAAKP